MSVKKISLIEIDEGEHYLAYNKLMCFSKDWETDFLQMFGYLGTNFMFYWYTELFVWKIKDCMIRTPVTQNFSV